MKHPTATTGRKVLFNVSAKSGSQVFVAGTFNNWDPTATPLQDTLANGQFKTSLRIPIGTHEYKFVINGLWIMDPKCLEWITNNHGSLNNVIHA